MTRWLISTTVAGSSEPPLVKSDTQVSTSPVPSRRQSKCVQLLAELARQLVERGSALRTGLMPARARAANLSRRSAAIPWKPSFSNDRREERKERQIIEATEKLGEPFDLLVGLQRV